MPRTAFQPSTPDVSDIQRRTLIVLAMMQIIGTVGVGVAPTIGVLLATEVTDNEAWAGLARTASTLGAALMGMPLGNLAARRGRRVALSLGWWIAAVGGAFLVAAAQWSLVFPMFIGLTLIGSGSAVVLQARFAATDLAEPRHRARSLSLIVWVGTLGMVLGPNLGVPGEIISEKTGLAPFAAAFLIATVFFALAGTMVFALLRPDPLLFLNERDGQSAPKNGRRRGGLRRLFAVVADSKSARYSVIAILTAQIVMVSIMTMTPVHMRHHGDSITVIGITISLHIAGMYFLAPLVGLMVDRFGYRVPVVAGLVTFIASLVVAALWPHSTNWVVVSLILLGVGWSFVNVAASAMFSGAIPMEGRASAQGGVDALANLSGAVAAFAAGPLLAFTNFTVMAMVAMVVLVPLAVLTAKNSIFSR